MARRTAYITTSRHRARRSGHQRAGPGVRGRGQLGHHQHEHGVQRLNHVGERGPLQRVVRPARLRAGTPPGACSARPLCASHLDGDARAPCRHTRACMSVSSSSGSSRPGGSCGRSRSWSTRCTTTPCASPANARWPVHSSYTARGARAATATRQVRALAEQRGRARGTGGPDGPLTEDAKGVYVGGGLERAEAEHLGRAVRHGAARARAQVRGARRQQPAQPKVRHLQEERSHGAL